MSILVKLGISCWMTGLVIVLIGCFFGIAGAELTAGCIAGVGAFIAIIGAFCGFIEFIKFIWKQ